MRKIVGVLILAGLVITGAGDVFAGNLYDPVIQQRISNEQWRIDQGIATGELTAREAARVQRSLNSIRAQEARFKADGYLGRWERATLQERLHRNSERIYRLKHNPFKREGEIKK